MSPSMLSIEALLNGGSSPDQGSDSSDDSAGFTSHVGSEPKLEVNTSNHRIDKLFRSRVHPSLLANRKLLDIALRRKLAPKRTPTAANCGLKLHRKLLEAGLRVRLISAPSIYEIYYQLMPLTSQSKQLYRVVADPARCTLKAENMTPQLLASRKARAARGALKAGEEYDDDGRMGEAGPTHTWLDPPRELLRTGKMTGKTVRLIDSNLVNLAGVPLKVLKSLTYDKSATGLGLSVRDHPEELVRTFNNLDTAVASSFQEHNYSLVRVTKCAASNTEASALVKLETAKMGDPALVDDGEFIEDMVASLGELNQLPSNLFIKKVIARPRYKVDMKLYFVPTDAPMLLYVDARAFERDLINGIVDILAVPDRHICTTFDPEPALSTVRGLVWQSAGCRNTCAEQVPNHITENLHKYFVGTPGEHESGDSSPAFSAPESRSSMFSSSNNSVASGCSSVSTGSSVK